jgi:acetyl-CoA carboxylase beta subunit
MARCSLCGKEMPYNDLEEHYDRCSSIDYVYRESRKHLHKTFDKQKLWEMDNQTFDRFYWKVCDELFKVMPRSLQRHCLENAILTHQGKEPKYSMEELQEMIDKQH